jgi:prepilin signal peptidase PulO-like enzyme (type II secretory pathway)
MRRDASSEQTELALGGGRIDAPLVPFGVFLAPAAMLTLLWGDAFISWLKST